MVNRYYEIKPVLENLLGHHPFLADFLLSIGEEIQLKGIHSILLDFESITLSLQRREMTFAKCRVLFEGVMNKYPFMNKYISTSSAIVNFPEFESAIFKIVTSRESELTIQEEAEVQSLLLSQVPSQPTAQVKSVSFADSLLTSYEMEVESVSKFIDLQFIPPGSVIVESLFSIVGHMFGDRRMSSSPVHIEEQVFLRVNRDLWDENTFFKILEEEKK
jgi:hypothetical protein